MTRTDSRSQDLYTRAQRVLPGGVSRNTVLRRPHPLYADHGEGCRVWDVEGVERIDFANNMASLIHGHAFPPVVEAVTRQLQRGTAFTTATEQEVDFAEFLVERSASFEMIRFVNSGTEAVMSCIKAARALTGRPGLAKVEGAYHGLYDWAEVSQTAQPDNWGAPDQPASVPVAQGTPRSALDQVVVLPFDDPARAIARLDEHADDIACVLLDPMPHRVGLVPAAEEFVTALRRWCDAHGALLVFDEVITFRSEHGGAQEWYPVRPDLTAMGKVIGGGFPVGALAGRAEAMRVMDPLVPPVRFPHSGTFSANPVTMTAGLVAMQHFDRDAVAHVNALADRARTDIAEAARVAGVPACVTGRGSMFRVHLKAEPPRNYRAAYAPAEEIARLGVLLDHLFATGLMLINTCSGTISTPMTAGEIDHLAEAFLGGFRKLAALGPRPELAPQGGAA
ncbi:aminotransferase class III-fold pyridoxal phosphate-dependent enzyme [bacterium]|nr:aminotransferase class III-fold pyridoxal phosphate-dependent enzyme [bacterium]